MALTHLLQPISINGLEIKNRIVRTAHGTSYGKGVINDDLVAYHEARARAGVGLTTLEATVVHRSTINNTLFAWDDSVIPGFKAMAAALRPHGCRVFVQLWHGGHHWPPMDGGPGWSASTVPSPWGGVPIAMSTGQISEIVEAFADAAVRARAGEMDGVEIHFGHGYLIHQFLSEMTNRRQDAYGGDLDGRLRFGREVIAAVRRKVGRDYPVGIRISDQHAHGGLTPEEAAEVVRRLCAERTIDFVNASMGSYHDIPSMLPAMDTPTGAMNPSAEPIAAAADVPTMIAGRYRTLEDADQAIREGVADMIGMVRAMIADPDLVKKTLAGHPERVRPCIGCNQGCVAGILGPMQRMLCTVNPTVGFERTLHEDLIVRAAAPKRVVVVGGGPAGMEAARVAALAGHRVVLFEARPGLGGVAAIARRAPKLAGIGDILGWLEQEVYRLGVDVRLSTYADAAEVTAERPDVVIVAAGSTPRMDGVQASIPGSPARGVDLPHVVSSHEVFDLPRERLGASALVLDDVGHYEAIAVAEQLIERGLKVTYLTRLSQFAPAIEYAVRTEPALRRLRHGDFTLVTRGRLIEVRPGECQIGFLEGEQVQTVAADTVVLVTHNMPATEVFDALGGRDARGAPQLKIVGDALSPRDLLVAIREGHMAARTLA